MNNDINTINEIKKLKNSYNREMVILGHYYQRKEIIEVSDYCGDSFELSKIASNLPDAKYIIFCGVHFMAESASILSKANQIVQIPAMDAGCPMADMADYSDVKIAWEILRKNMPDSCIIPVTYMNSTAEIKAFCGKNGGAVCTSSNAEKILRWAFDHGDKVMFLPDEHLGRNTAKKLGLTGNDIFLLDNDINQVINRVDQLRNSKLILWNGYCHVHTFFTVEHINNIRKKYPEATIIVHPECRQEVVDIVDYNGSTSFIYKFAQNAPVGSTIAIATEVNMIDRLSREFPDKNIIDVARSMCPNMYKINLNNLKKTIDNIGMYNIVAITGDIKEYAGIALRKMIEITSS